MQSCPRVRGSLPILTSIPPNPAGFFPSIPPPGGIHRRRQRRTESSGEPATFQGNAPRPRWNRQRSAPRELQSHRVGCESGRSELPNATRSPAMVENPSAVDSGPGAIAFPPLAPSARPSSGSGNRSRFSGSSWVLAGRFGIVSRFRLRLVPFGSLRSCTGIGLGALLVLSKFESPPPPLVGSGTCEV
jgi:hypothetical protein